MLEGKAAVGMNEAEAPFRPHTSHWGVFSVRMVDGQLEVRPHGRDPDEIIQNFPGALRHRARIARQIVRRRWLENGPDPDERRSRDDFVPVSWEPALDLLARELAASATVPVPVRSLAAPMDGPARAGFTTRKARSIAF